MILRGRGMDLPYQGREARVVALQDISDMKEAERELLHALRMEQEASERLHELDRIKDTFAVYRRKAGIAKPVSPHILRHTMATTLLFNGCPIGHIKELLGHERLDTTCRYYLGLDRRAARAAHAQFLHYA